MDHRDYRISYFVMVPNGARYKDPCPKVKLENINKWLWVLCIILCFQWGFEYKLLSMIYVWMFLELEFDACFLYMWYYSLFTFWVSTWFCLTVKKWFLVNEYSWKWWALRNMLLLQSLYYFENRDLNSILLVYLLI